MIERKVVTQLMSNNYIRTNTTAIRPLRKKYLPLTICRSLNSRMSKKSLYTTFEHAPYQRNLSLEKAKAGATLGSISFECCKSKHIVITTANQKKGKITGDQRESKVKKAICLKRGKTAGIKSWLVLLLPLFDRDWRWDWRKYSKGSQDIVRQKQCNSYFFA